MRAARFGPRGRRALVSIGLALLASIVAGGTVPHMHDHGPGLYNQEHDITTLAALGGVGPLPGVVTIALGPLTRRPLACAPALRPPCRPSSDNASRAPPASA